MNAAPWPVASHNIEGGGGLALVSAAWAVPGGKNRVAEWTLVRPV